MIHATKNKKNFEITRAASLYIKKISNEIQANLASHFVLFCSKLVYIYDVALVYSCS